VLNTPYANDAISANTKRRRILAITAAPGKSRWARADS